MDIDGDNPDEITVAAVLGTDLFGLPPGDVDGDNLQV